MRTLERGGLRAGLDLEALIQGVYVDGEGFHVSPDGRKVAFVWNKIGQWQIYLVGFKDEQPAQLTAGNESCLSPRFSPDTKRLAYLQDYQGDEKFDIFIRDLESNESKNITPDTDEAILPIIFPSGDQRGVSSLLFP